MWLRSKHYKKSLPKENQSLLHFPYLWRRCPTFFFILLLSNFSNTLSSHFSVYFFLSIPAKMHLSYRTLLLAGLLQSVRAVVMDNLAVEFNTAVASGGEGILAERKLLPTLHMTT